VLAVVIPDAWVLVPFCLLEGAVSGLAFWLLIGRPRPKTQGVNQ